jgi:phage terminase small subunit
MTQQRLIPAPPQHLSVRSQEIWRTVVRHPMSAGRALMIETALQEFDRANEIREVISREGAMAKAKGKSKMAHVHPLTGVEQRARATFLKLWLHLHLDWRQDVDGVMYPGE